MTVTVETFDSTNSTVNIATAIDKLDPGTDLCPNDKFISFMTPGNKVVVVRIHLPP